ncbi:double zinc ribbon and ankyrin repeat-containing protein 1 [Myripristis murdjan]|uniref:double zinc ribbon and ankyrin repeat-containing protein 1 n=1 Tax=Myripristis murdjan TaxID=586833 RepID=UPI0011763C28|nr:double zinc ribbon and ankyrin repeat-containing protein 1 [Myripristis murdjan]
MPAGCIMTPHIVPLRLPRPGRARQHIDTGTPVEMKSDSPEVQIYYSLDGSQPAASAGSRKYSRALLLPPGRVCVRAVAVSSDGRQSAVVTKVFSVESVDSNEPKSMKETGAKGQQEDQQDDQQQLCDVTSCSAEISAGSSQQLPEPRMMGNAPNCSLTGPRFLNSRLGPPKMYQAPQPPRNPSSDQYCQTEGVGARDGLLESLSSTQRNRIHRQTDFLRCARCLSPRPPDPFARFCPQCGAALPAVPAQRLPPAEGGQVLQCVHCDALVPVNCAVCVLCEAAVAPQLQPQASATLQDHVVCVSCGSGNPAGVPCCVLCERPLPATAGCVGHSAPSVRSADHRLLCCSNCKRFNQTDARYCDWCGCKRGSAVSSVCVRCGASGQPHALYCSSCGNFLQAPPPPAVGATPLPRTATPSSDVTRQVAPSRGPSPHKASAPPTANQQTQTVGLFYPSSTELQRRQSGQQRAPESSKREARPPTAVSPGRGYWRQQLDHVCAHLRSFTQNNAAFRALLGEPRLGRVVSAVLQEDQQEVSLTVSFMSAGQDTHRTERTHTPTQVSGAGGLSSVTEGSADRLTGSGRSGHRKPSKLNLTANTAPKPPLRDAQLLQELGPEGQGQICAVQKLLDQGADPSCRDSSGRPALVVAVVNGHHDVLPVLVQRGADINQQSGAMKNTALHEAAALGRGGLQSVRLLLSCGASLHRRNGGGQTAFDMAVSSGCTEAVSLLTAHSGQDLLSKLVPPRANMAVC